jgi:predicted ATPase
VFIKKLKVENFKSISKLSLENISNLAIFAGPNGSGKSNFFESIEFIRDVLRYGTHEAIKRHGGYENIHSHKLRDKNAQTFSAEMALDFKKESYVYEMRIEALNGDAPLYEVVSKNRKKVASREYDGKIYINDTKQSVDYSRHDSILKLISSEVERLVDFLTSIERYQVDPYKAREADDYYASDTLDRYASNLPTVLKNIENDAGRENIEEILEAMQLIVPGLENVTIEKERLNNKSVVVFKEKGIKKKFPANLVSDGTIYALAMLLILYSNKKGIIMIEEPERGLHAKAIAELIELFREKSNDIAIFVNTHSESVIRVAHPEELFIVDKVNGRTQIFNVKQKYPNYNYTTMNLDTMWMSNMFDGGLPW